MTEPSRPDYPQLDAMRAVAAIAVVATHTAFWAGLYSHGLLGAATQRLEVGVAIFFVLSGFLLGRPYVAQALGVGTADEPRRYFRKRALRILPVYLVCATGALALIPANRDLGVDRWLQNLFLVDLYRAQQLPQGLTQMWSLSIEVAFYLFLPLIGVLLVRAAGRRSQHAGRLLAALAATSLLSVTWVAVTHLVDATWAAWAARWLPAYLTWFAIGMAIAVVDVQVRRGAMTTSWIVVVARDRATCWFAAVAVFVLVATPLGGSPLLVAPTASQAMARHVAYAVIAMLVVVPCVLGPTDTWVARALSLPQARHLGHLSYSLFSVHMLVLYLAAPRLGFPLFQSSWPLLFLTVLAASLAISELLYRFVELPFLRLKSPRSRSTEKSTAPSDTATHH